MNLPTWPVAQYIRSHRDRLAPRGVPILSASLHALADYFAAADLDRALIVEQDPLPLFGLGLMSLPSSVARSLGWSLVDPSDIAAITFDHVIATRQPMSPALLFHELVHVVQFRLLGIDTFARHYTRGFFQTGRYDQIPLERCAYDLEARFAQCAEPFDVEAAVREQLEI